MNIAITDKTFEELVGNVSLPTFLMDSTLNILLKYNDAAREWFNINEEILDIAIKNEEIIDQLEVTSIYFLTLQNFTFTFSKVQLEGISSVLLTISQQNEDNKFKVLDVTSTRLKKELVNHTITRKKLANTKEFSWDIIDNKTDIALVVDKDGIITKNNHVTSDYFSGLDLSGRSIKSIFAQEGKIDEIANQLSKERNFEGEVILLFENDSTATFYLNTYQYLGQKNEHLFLFRDQSDKRTIKEQARKMKAILDSGQHMIWTVDQSLTLTSFNENYRSVFKELYNEDPILNRPLNAIEYRFENQSIRDFWNEKYEEAFKGNNVFFETTIDGKLGNEYYKEVYLNPIFNDKGEVVEVSGIGLDITEKRITQLKLTENTIRYNSIFDNATVMIWSIDKNGHITAANRSFQNSMKLWFDREVKTGSDFYIYFSDNPNSNNLALFKKNFEKALQNKAKHFNIQFYSKDQQLRYLELYINPISLKDEIVEEVSCVAVDITATKQANLELNESLKEKETLLQEVHHRVKNNLQIISSIVKLQCSYIEDDQALKVLTESQNRINSMSFIHESLYMNNNFRYIDFKDYIKSLTANLIQSYFMNPEQITFDVEIEDIQVNIDQAIPCGLILNELVSNALKHAFPENKAGNISLSITEKGDTVTIEVKDNGIGIPQNFKIEDNESLGLNLVFILVEQLDGNIEIVAEEGSKFLINFDKIKNS